MQKSSSDFAVPLLLLTQKLNVYDYELDFPFVDLFQNSRRLEFQLSIFMRV